jgi:hypothetical protein
MSISKRLIDLARAELNSLLDRAARAGDGDEDRESRRSHGDGDFAGMSAEELAAEIENRRRAREEVDDLLGGKRRRPDPEGVRLAGGPGGFGLRDRAQIVSPVDAQVPPGSAWRLAREVPRGDRSHPAADSGLQDAREAPAPVRRSRAGI